MFPSVCNFIPFVGKRSRIDGFTLVELIITLVVIGILAAISAPAFNRFTETNRLTAATNDLITDLNLARTEVLKRNQGQAVVCVSTDGTGCTAGSETWAAGWIVFWDGNSSGSYDSPPDVMIRIHGPLPERFSATTDPADTQSISFSARGTADALSLQIANSSISANRLVCIAMTGRANVAPEGAASC